MTNLTNLSTEELQSMLARAKANRDEYIRVELGKSLTDYNRANSETPVDDLVYDLISEIADRELMVKEAASEAEWTLQTFIARRAEWNSEVVKIRADGRTTPAEREALAKKLGYSFEDLKRAKTMLGVI